MICRDLRDLLRLLEAVGELHAVPIPVDPRLEIAAITDRVCKSDNDNRALLFARVAGSEFRVTTNLFGSARRLALALGIAELAELTRRFDAILGTLPGTGAGEKLSRLIESDRWRKAAPAYSGAPDRLTEDASLDELPLLKGSPLDGQPENDGRFLTLPLVITAAPGCAEFNCGMYRAAFVDNETLAVSWGAGSGAAAHAAAWRAAGKPMPVTVALGGPPALTFAAMLPLPVDEFTFTGLLQGEPLELFRCESGLPAPATAEAVLEGYLLPESVPSGAFGNHTGSYTPSAPAATIGITSIRCRPDMILPATIVGRPPMEDCWLARAGGHLLLSLLKIDVPEVTGLHLPFSGIFHGAAIIAVSDAIGRGKELIAAIRQTGWLAASRLLVIVDDAQDPADEAGVAWRVMNNVDWERDLLVDGDRLSIDATRKPGSREPVVADASVEELVTRRWRKYGFKD